MIEVKNSSFKNHLISLFGCRNCETFI